MLADKKFILAGSIVLLACFSCDTSSNEDFSSLPEVEIDLPAITKRGYITALVDNNSISYFIYKGQAMGYEYELLQLLAKQLHVGLKIKVTSGVERAIDQLNKGQGDILAFPLTITKARRKFITFTSPHFNTYQVLVQRKPSDWEKLGPDQINDGLIRNPVKLIGKDVYVIKGTSFELRLKNLSEEIGGDINIRLDTMTAESESVIKKVANGEIDYTVADHSMAQVNAAYYPNLDVNTVLSVPQQIAWAVRKNSPKLQQAINGWLTSIKKEPTFMVIYNRYYKSLRTSVLRMKSDYSSIGDSEKLSPYDDLIRLGATKLKWDWLLLAALVYQESKFNAEDESWAGARGLMQLMPETAKRFGASNLNDPEQSMKAGIGYLSYLNRYWLTRVPDSTERIKFVLASYNAGLSHIIDATRLTQKNDHDPTIWKENVEFYLKKKSESKFYHDPVVKAGYCQCDEPVNYVNEVLERYEQYKTHLSEVDAISMK
jgi:membrane-bound lytic murein transglycosylase F